MSRARAALPALVAAAALGGAAVGGVAAGYLGSGRHRRLGATPDEVQAPLPGDELVPNASITATRAITIDAPPEYVWPWIAQLGQTRGGFYSYAAVENLAGCRIRNADTIVSDWQHPQAGDAFHLHPDIRLRLAVVHEGEALVAHGEPEPGEPPGYAFSWAFVVQPTSDGRARLLIRERYLPHHPSAERLIRASSGVATVMTLGTLRGVRQRAEQLFGSGV